MKRITEANKDLVKKDLYGNDVVILEFTDDPDYPVTAAVKEPTWIVHNYTINGKWYVDDPDDDGDNLDLSQIPEIETQIEWLSYKEATDKLTEGKLVQEEETYNRGVDVGLKLYNHNDSYSILKHYNFKIKKFLDDANLFKSNFTSRYRVVDED
jgi:hypothetical protein